MLMSRADVDGDNHGAAATTEMLKNHADSDGDNQKAAAAAKMFRNHTDGNGTNHEYIDIYIYLYISICRDD